MPRGLTPHEVHAFEKRGRIPDLVRMRREVSGRLHFCREWDFMLIDETDPEFKACLCQLLE